MNAPVPPYDFLGFPMVPWTMQLLMQFTLAVHWSFIGLALGGSAFLLMGALRGRHSELSIKVNERLVSFIIFGISYGITFGIAPLLFVQVLYGQFFYSANILIGFWWFNITLLLIFSLYLLYYARQHFYSGKNVNAFVPLAALFFLLVIGHLLVSNTVLTMNPKYWMKFYWTWHSGAPFWGDVFLPRWLFAIFGLLTMGGFMTAFVARFTIPDEHVRSLAIRRAYLLPAIFGPLQAGAGLALLLALPANLTSVALTQWPAAFYTYWAMGTFFLAIIVAVAVARRTQTKLAVSAPVLLSFSGLFTLALVCDIVRQVSIENYFKLSQVPVTPQWGAFWMFLGLLAFGLAMVSYLVYLALAYQGKTDADLA